MDDEDDYIVCGTPLPDPEDGPSAQRRGNRELQVRDEKGRQRFHGAFTGGFSAGYFNTVGTKEGWAPSSFVSSRSKAAEQHVEQQPEDFMDAEDFSEFGIAPRKIHTTDKFRDVGSVSRKRKAPDYSDFVIPGEPPLKELIQPVAESIGIQILVKMGWKPGQGIGPRIRKGNVKKKARNTDGINSSSVECITEDDDDPMLSSFTFAPEDTSSLPYVPKDDFHGIGYTGLCTKPMLSIPSVSSSSHITKSWLPKSKKKLLISGKAFGIGALEEEDDDDDVYSHEDMSQYDFSEFLSSQKNTKETEREPPASQSTFDAVLDGFIKSAKASTVRKKFPLPQLPSGYTPVRRSVLASGDPKPTTSKCQVLTAEDRSLILGERKFVIAGHNNDNPLASNTAVPVDQNHTSSTRMASSGFQPFVSSPEKQKRYEEYLKLSQKEHFKALQPAHMTEWEKQQELEEFARAASLYQPMSKMLSSRFVSRTHLEAETQVGIVKLERSSPEKVTPSGPSHSRTEWHPAPLLCKRFNIPNPYPNSTNVGVPHSGKKQRSLFDCLSLQDDTEKTIDLEVQEMPPGDKAPEVPVKIEPEESQKDSGGQDMKVKESLTSVSEEIAPGVIKPPMDLFKAIFEDTSDEEEEEEEESDHSQDTHSGMEISSPNKTSVPSDNKNNSAPPASTSSTHNSAPPTQRKAFGVFANLDLDMLNRSHSAASDTTPSSAVNADSTVTVAGASTSCDSSVKVADVEQQHEDKSVDKSEHFYGPKLPPPGFTPLPVEPKSHSHKHSKRKEKHKHNKHKKKNKKKKKKRSSRDSAKTSGVSSDSSDEDDIDPLTIIKKLNELHRRV